MTPTSDLSEMTTIVVGASRGLGRGITTAFAAAGAPVIAVARTAVPLADQAAGGGSIQPEVADAGDPTFAGSLLDRYEPTAVILVAGASPLIRPLQHQTWETFSVNWHTDVRIAFDTCSSSASHSPRRSPAPLSSNSYGQTRPPSPPPTCSPARGQRPYPDQADVTYGPQQEGGTMISEHRTGTQEEWQAERDELLKEEKELTRRGDELARKRRQLPWVAVEKDYRFETGDGTKTLADLFDGRSQLLVYHFMFGPPYEAGCPVCSSITDTLAPQVPHLEARDTTLLLASRAPLQKLLAYRERMGWGIPWVSTVGSDFNRDLGFLHTMEELMPFLEGEIPLTVEQNAAMCGTDAAGYVTEGPGLSAYALSNGTVYRTYVTTARGLEPAMAYYGLLDRTPEGRRESASEPLWVRRHDEY
jgi:predicted dithiol-disulfide oxidoreductase (DUF899 family)